MKNLFYFLGGLLLGAILFSLGKNYYEGHFNRLSSSIDFNKSGYAEQLVSGWYQLESPSSGGYRWTGKKAVARLGCEPGFKHITASVYIRDINVYPEKSIDVDLQVNDQTVQSRHFEKSGLYTIEGPLPTGLTDGEMIVAISLNKIFVPSQIGQGDDQRQLGLVVSRIGLSN